jgi:hypothetical protein
MTETAPASPLRRAGLGLSGGLLYLLLLDAAVETWLAASPARWIVVATVAAYLALSALLRRRLAGGMRVALSLVMIFALLAFSAWRPAGAYDGIVMLRQPPGTVLTGLTALAILLAAWTLARAAFMPPAIRIIAVALAVYALAATVWGMVAATPYPALVHGQSLWTRLPFWLQGAFVGGLVLLPAALLVQVGAAIVGRQGGLRRRDLLLAITSALSLAIVAAGFVARQDAGGVAGGVGQNGPGLRPLTVAALQLPVPRTPDLAFVEPEHFAAALGKDPVRIFEFVRDQVAYEPYVGCLRGPRGTLLALAGNSVDRAALLASLLTHAGHRARFVHGPLPDSRVQDLVASVFAERPEAGPSQPQPHGPGKTAADVLAAGVDRDVKALVSSLKDAGLPAQAEVTSLQSLLEETRDHYWVQWWRDGNWVDLDPSFATAAPGATYARPVATFDALPDALFHRVDIRIRLEEYTGAARSTREVLQYSAKAADLSGVDIALVHLAERPRDRAKGSGLGAFSSGGGAAGQAGQLRPVLIVRGQAVAGAPFWRNAPRKSSGAGFDSLFGGGDEEAAPVAVAVGEFLQFEFVAPGGRKDSVVREVFDLVGPARRRNGETLKADAVAALTNAAGSHALTRILYDLFVTTGSVHAAHLENVVSLQAPAEAGPVDLQAGLQRVNILFAALSDGLVGRMPITEGQVCRFYLDSPRVHIAELSVGPTDVRLSMDLRRDHARAVGTGVRKEQLFGAQVLRGVFDGHLERLLIDYLNTSDVPGSASTVTAMSTSLVFELAQASKAPLVFLEKDTTALAADVPADGRARVDEALAAGWVALAPKGPVGVGGAPRFAWWQIDRRSGSTVAVTDAGLHAAKAELGALVRDEPQTIELVMIESEQNGKVVVFEGGAAGQAQMSYATAHPANFANAGEAYKFANGLMRLMKSNNQLYHFTHYLTGAAL